MIVHIVIYGPCSAPISRGARKLFGPFLFFSSLFLVFFEVDVGKMVWFWRVVQLFRQGSLEFYSSIIQQTQFLYFPRSTLGFSPLVRVLVRGSVCLPFPYFRPCSRTMLLFHGDHQVIISVSASGWTTQPGPNCFLPLTYYR